MYTFQYNKKYYYSVYVSFFGEFMQNEILSLRAKQQAIKKFREQAKSESLTQGDFLEKILNVYLGIPIENSSIPFKIALFWINNLDKNDKNLDKKIYSGYGELLYSSSIFDYYGITYKMSIKIIIRIFVRNCVFQRFHFIWHGLLLILM